MSTVDVKCAVNCSEYSMCVGSRCECLEGLVTAEEGQSCFSELLGNTSCANVIVVTSLVLCRFNRLSLWQLLPVHGEWHLWMLERFWASRGRLWIVVLSRWAYYYIMYKYIVDNCLWHCVKSLSDALTFYQIFTIYSCTQTLMSALLTMVAVSRSVWTQSAVSSVPVVMATCSWRMERVGGTQWLPLNLRLSWMTKSMTAFY